MDVNIDGRKCGDEYSLCKRCKYEGNIDLWAEKCQFCTMVVDIGYSMILCGIPIGSGISWLHRNFEEKETR